MQSPEIGLLDYRRKNIGDDIQSFSILQHLTAVDTLYAREELRSVDRPTQIVMNSWFMYPDAAERNLGTLGKMLSRFKRPQTAPSEYLDPVFFGFCLGRPAMLAEGWKRYLKAHEPIGCRDTDTVAALNKAGIDAYWTGCITMYGGRRFDRVPAAARDDILFIDVDAETEKAFVPEHVSRQAVRHENVPTPGILKRSVRRFADAATVIERLSRARLVVTRRLHVALPCVGLGTPVVVIADATISEARWRFSGFQRVLPVYFKDEPHRAKEIDWDDVRTAEVPADIVAHYDRLKARLGTPETHDRVPATGAKVRIRNPGLGAKARPLQLGVGRRTERCVTLQWSADAIELDLPDFAGLDRMRVVVAVEEGDRWTPLGALADLRLA